MTILHHYINNFIYPTDNIPDHRSRQFGCSPCLMAVREFAPFQQKTVFGQPPKHGQCKTNHSLKQSVLPFHHTIPACAKQTEKGSSQKFTPYIKEN